MIDTIHIAVCMKPIDGNFAQNALEHGVAGLNIDGCRIGTEKRKNAQKGGENLNLLSRPSGADSENAKSLGCYGQGAKQITTGYKEVEGRFPANVILDGSDEVTEQFPETKSGGAQRGSVIKTDASIWHSGNYTETASLHNDEGSAARFFKECEPDD
jgi:site-specific DNA-methyltransferase (adenine-specific)